MNGYPEDWYGVIDDLKQLREPKKIKDYIVVAAQCKSRLSRLILEWSAHGYCLYHGPFTNKESDDSPQEVCQAMVKYEAEEDLSLYE